MLLPNRAGSLNYNNRLLCRRGSAGAAPLYLGCYLLITVSSGCCWGQAAVCLPAIIVAHVAVCGASRYYGAMIAGIFKLITSDNRTGEQA